jgi:hypothetical protein
MIDYLAACPGVYPNANAEVGIRPTSVGVAGRRDHERQTPDVLPKFADLA